MRTEFSEKNSLKTKKWTYGLWIINIPATVYYGVHRLHTVVVLWIWYSSLKIIIKKFQFTFQTKKRKIHSWLGHKNVQLNEYKTDPCFLQFFQSNTTGSLIIYVFSKIYEPECELEIVFVLALVVKTKHFHFLVHKSYKTHKSTLSYIGNFEGNIDCSRIRLAVIMTYLT